MGAAHRLGWTWAEADAWLGPFGQRRAPHGRETYIRRTTPTTVAVTYRGTDVVVFNSDGTTRLYAGEHKTATTKSRMNTYTRAIVKQRQGIWFVGAAWPHQKRFFDGITIGADGHPLRDQQPPSRSLAEGVRRALQKVHA